MGLLQWALLALLVAIAAGTLGFAGGTQKKQQFAKVLSGIFLVLALVMLVLVVLGIGTKP